MVPSARNAAVRMGLTECSGGRFARACSLSGYWMGLFWKGLSSPRTGMVRDKVMAGGTPANPATKVSASLLAPPQARASILGE